MDIFKKLESGEAVDMYTPEYRSVVEELHRILFLVPLSSRQGGQSIRAFWGTLPAFQQRSIATMMFFSVCSRSGDFPVQGFVWILASTISLRWSNHIALSPE